MKGDSTWNHVNQDLQPTRLKPVGKDQHFLLDDASDDIGCVDASVAHGLETLEATWKEVPLALSRLSEGVSVAASQIVCSTEIPVMPDVPVVPDIPDIQQFIPFQNLPVLIKELRAYAEDLEVARTNSMLSASTGDDLDQMEEGTQFTLRTEDEIKQVVDFVVDRLLNFLGLPNKYSSTKSSACNGSLPFDDEQVSSMPITQTREYRQLRSSSRSQCSDESRREKSEEIPMGETTPEITGQDEDSISAIPMEYDLETFSRHSLMEDASTKPDQVMIDHCGKEMIIDRRTIEGIMDFLVFPENYLDMNEPKTYTRNLIASLKQRRAEMANKMTPGLKSADSSPAKSVGRNFENFMDFIAFPEKHCIPRLKASLQGKNVEHRTYHTGINKAELRTTDEERIFAEFLDQQCNIDKNTLRNKFITSAKQGGTTSSGEYHDGGQGLYDLRRDESFLSQSSNSTNDSSHGSVRSSKSGRFFGSGMRSSKPQKGKNAVERYLTMATKG